MRKTFLVIILMFLTRFVSFGQNTDTGTLRGFIYDDLNGEVLIGVNIYFPELAIGSSTNTSGYYIISNIPLGEHTLICEYLGYRSISTKINIPQEEKKHLDFRMEISALQGEMVEVVADSIRTSVKLYKKPISNIQLSARQIEAIPQVAEADLLRSLQTLPGILPVSDFSSALYVRGGTPDQNLYLLDGTDVYNPEHAFGIFSTFNTDAIKHVEISKGGFDASYGGRLSSVLDVINLDGNREEFEGQASISLLSAKTTLQMPVGNFGALSGSIRRTYFDKTLRKSIDEIPDYYFYDGNIKGFFEIDNRNKVTVSAYGGRDILDFVFNPDAKEKAGFQYDWGNKTGSIRWTRVFNSRMFANFWLTGSRFSSNFDLGETVPVVERNYITDITLKGNLEYHYSQHFITRFGFEQKNFHVVYRQTFPEGSVDIDKRPRHYVSYLQTNWRPSLAWDIQMGLRYNYFQSDKDYQDIEPRFLAKYRLNETINLKVSAGIYKQYLHRIPRSFVTDIWTISNEFQQQSTAQHYILGIQKEITQDFEMEIETYYKNYNNIYSFNPTFIAGLRASRFDEKGDPVYSETRGLFNKGKGNTYGFELLMRKDAGVVTGWLGYSYANTEYQIAGINNDEYFPPRHDRRSTVNLVSKIDLRNAIRSLKNQAIKRDNNRWTIGLNLIYASGQPITVPGSAYIVGRAPNVPNRTLSYYPAEINGFRLPAYARLDVSLTYRREYRNWTMSPYIQIFNIGNRKNVWFIDYDFNEGVSDVETINMFPILPTIGVNFYF